MIHLKNPHGTGRTGRKTDALSVQHLPVPAFSGEYLIYKEEKMSFPFRFSMLSLNLWNTEKWDERCGALKEFLQRFNPDICCFQEIRQDTMNYLDGVLSSHSRVHDSFNGWNNEGNIYFKKELFEEMNHGEVFLDMPEPDRRVFCVKLKTRYTEKVLTAATVHLTHQNNKDEQDTGFSYRHPESIKIAEWINKEKENGAPIILAGDFNDPVHPSRILSGAGMEDVFISLGLLSPPTFPALPVTGSIFMNESIDRIMGLGGIRPISAAVPQFFYKGRGVSDHWPVHAVYEFL